MAEQLIQLGESVPVQHWERPKEIPFLAKERETTTLLFGGLTEAHEELLGAHLRGMGYKVERLPVPDSEGLQVGKEYCNRAQCNPTYFTIGNLVAHLKKLAAETSIEEVEKNYIFITAGSCGPCRFGMYESEYRKAVVDAGFERFRIYILQQTQGFDHVVDRGERPGIDFNKEFVLGLLKSVLLGDNINQLVFKIEPYEIEQGATRAAKADALAMLAQCMESKSNILLTLNKVRRRFAQVRCDFTRVKPVVKITGEFWASITEGAGNYFLKQWLVEEGAEVMQEPLTGWVEHLMFSREIKAYDRRTAREQEEGGIGVGNNPYVQEAKLLAFRRLVNGTYNLYRAALGFKPNDTLSNRVLAELADPYYNKRMGGGEAYMEVGALIYCAKTSKVHMMISVKPFGCMPSTASDGVQSKVVADYPNVIFLPVETSGDSEVNFKSRVQMKLFEARQKARTEFDRVVEEHGIDIDAVQRFVQDNPQYQRGTFVIPQHTTGTAASFVIEMDRRMRSKRGRLRHGLAKAAHAAERQVTGMMGG